MKKIFFIIIILLSISVNAQFIPKDKQLHLEVGAVISGWAYNIPQQSNVWKPFIYSVGAVTNAGAGKELLDINGYGTPDIKDFEATIIGGIISAGLIKGFTTIFKNNKNKRFKIIIG